MSPSSAVFRAALAGALLLLPALATSGADEAVIDVPAETPLYATLVEATRAAVAAELQQPVALEVTLLRTQGDFAFLAARVQQPDGAPIDFRATVYDAAIAAGLFDGPQLWAFLQNSAGEWQVIEHDIGPTDAWFFGWPSAHGVSCAVLGDGISNC